MKGFLRRFVLILVAWLGVLMLLVAGWWIWLTAPGEAWGIHAEFRGRPIDPLTLIMVLVIVPPFTLTAFWSLLARARRRQAA